MKKVLQDELKIEAEARRFLLGEMSEDDRGAFEERFVADEELFERMCVVEDELIESYVGGTMNAAEKEKFERAFLTTSRRRERVEFTRAMFDKLAEQKEFAAAKNVETVKTNPSIWDLITGFFKFPSFAFGAALGILLFVFGGWFLLKNSKNNQEFARQNTPTATVESNQSNSNQNVQSNQSNIAVSSNLNALPKVETNKNIPAQKKEMPYKKLPALKEEKPKEERAAVSPVFALFAGTVRSSGKTQELNLPESAGNILLQLNLESRDYKIYTAQIVDADGAVIAGSKNLTADGSKIKFFVSARKLARGDYIVKLSALNPQNETESVADYPFRVNRK